METKTINAEDIKQLRYAICEAIEWIEAVAEERGEHTIVMMLQDAIDNLDLKQRLTDEA